jgi:hypothetical protein
MGLSDPDVQKKVFGARWQPEFERQSWPLWKRIQTVSLIESFDPPCCACIRGSVAASVLAARALIADRTALYLDRMAVSRTSLPTLQ